MNIDIPLLDKITSAIINPIILFLIFSGMVVFMWGVVEVIGNADDAEKRKVGYQHMWWGIIGLAIMVGAVGLMNVIWTTVQSFK